MSSLTVLSWNIESLSEQKLTATVGKTSVSLPALIANLAKQLGVQMITIMEVSRNSSAAIFVEVLSALNAKRPCKTTPQELPGGRAPGEDSQGRRDAYWARLQGCYVQHRTEISRIT